MTKTSSRRTPGGGDRRPDARLVAVGGGGVDVPVADRQRLLDRLLRLLGRDLEDAEPELGDLDAVVQSIERLGTGNVDLYLIHWPLPSKDLFLDTWRAFERIQEEGGARSIGVSNFRVEDLERLEQEAERRPTVNQIELHPRLQQAELRAWHADHDVATEAWSPLAQGDLLEDGTIETVAAHHERTPAQVILRWHLQLGNVVIPKSV